jgi:hypothetical protein
MDLRSPERFGQGLHGLVAAPPVLHRLLLGVPVAAMFAAALLGGLLRSGALADLAAAAPPLGRAAVHHAALMIGAFMGAVIAIERCVALKWRWGWLAPVACVASGAALLWGQTPLAALLLAAGSAWFAATTAAIVARQPAWHTSLLLAGAACWLAGNLLFLFGGPATATTAWWFAFLVMTIAAERLEMARLMRGRPGARATLAMMLGALALGAAASALVPAAGGVLYGAALAGLAGWLLRHDVARRTVHAQGLPRYMAVCLLAGYGWLGVAGLAWASWSAGGPGRDAALHALGLGFVFSMMMAHAPVILPAVARVKVRFGPWFYLPLAVLHGSLLLRLAGAFADPRAFGLGARFNAAAIALFILTLAGGALAFRHRPPRPGRPAPKA